MPEITCMKDLQQLVVQPDVDWRQYGEVYVKEWEDFILFDYAPTAEYAKRWNWFERSSRGLILNRRTGEVVARPFDKFFNYGQGERFPASGSQITGITEKLDGSLGILYRHQDTYRIATRGSFTGEQAQWATRYLNTHHRLPLLRQLPNDLTLLFEIIYPENRIVVDYGNREDLVLLAARFFNGQYLHRPDLETLAREQEFSLAHDFRPNFHEVSEIIEDCRDAPDATEEGYVVEFSDGSRFKFKRDQYLKLHRLLSGLSFKRVLEAYQNGVYPVFREAIPDEFAAQVEVWSETIARAELAAEAQVESLFSQAPKVDRKSFALWVKWNVPVHLQSSLFALLDGRRVVPYIYKALDWDAVERSISVPDHLGTFTPDDGEPYNNYHDLY